MKILVIRFSSIGDIVLTSPVVRCLKKQLPSAELHFLCKESMYQVVQNNPYISHVHFFRKNDASLGEDLRKEQFDVVIDLQKNRYSRRLVRKLGKHGHTFPKLNFRKFLLVAFKWNIMPHKHIVDRYFDAVRFLGVENDGKGLDFFITKVDLQILDFYQLPSHYVAVAVGSQHATKQIPVGKIHDIMLRSELPFVFLGDNRDEELVADLCTDASKTYNLCGKLPLTVSAACVKQADFVLTGDTGLMHIASAFHKKTISLWGNTVPEFGMAPYQPETPRQIFIMENKKLWCRPCSKLGYKRCPLGHFRCMQELPVEPIVKIINGKED